MPKFINQKIKEGRILKIFSIDHYLS